MNHRGPDFSAIKKIDDVFLGHKRLSIIDLDKRSNQPFEIGSYNIIFNGEIYNYKEIIASEKFIL
jgi:asparagine synthase (glutamine-hydrolysing)